MEDERKYLPTVNDRLRTAINILTNTPARCGSDACGCEDCARLRMLARFAAMRQLAEAIRMLGR